MVHLRFARRSLRFGLRLGRSRRHDGTRSVVFARGQHSPGNPGELVRHGNASNVGVRSCLQRIDPPCQRLRPFTDKVQYGLGAMDEQLSQIAVTVPGNVDETRFTASRDLPQYQPVPG